MAAIDDSAPTSSISEQQQQQQQQQKLSIDATKSLSELAQTFEVDGFLTLTSLLTPQFTNKLRKECMGIFDGVLEWLHVKGDIDFKKSYRSSLELNNECEKPLETTSSRGEKEKTITKAASKKYEYPLKVGLKNGYRELVMRSPGRYELALLLSDLPAIHCNDGMEGGCDDDNADDIDADYDGKWLLSTKLLKRAQDRTMQNNQSPIETAKMNSRARSNPCNQNDAEEESCLKQLLEWVQNSSNINGSNDANNGIRNEENCNQRQERYPIDEENMKTFMKLVGALLPVSDNNNNNATDIRNTETITAGSSRSPDKPDLNEYYLVNFSLLLATPGCPTQSWHADGGHTSIATHLPCHVFNVFVPLVDVPLAMGPTEVRPGTQYHTRNLAPMMLAARCKKTLRKSAVAELGMGDALVFDYRILHRGRANLSDEVVVGDDDAARADGEVDLCEEGGGVRRGDKDRDAKGRHRPVLVLTFARRWFVDVCNFPKNSIFASDETII